ncbi:MAG: hypothetical protein CVV45_06845 [Spirochaetae bacterium HGW-Spirochaetae-10]|nr:MAG: hypothetical protein CVV45_06845 [Spirochaetae bacterium HGW-Spirochaetae-10]
MNANDEQILTLVKQERRDEAMRLFVRQFQEKIYSVAYRMFLNHDDALDVSQETLIQADRALSGFRGDSSLDTFVYRITTNVCLNYCRKQARRRTVDPFDSQRIFESLRAGAESEPDVQCERKAKEKMLEAALQKIPEHLRIPVILHDLEGLTVPEIAAVLERTPAAVKSSLHRAKQSLKSILSSGIDVPGEEEAGRFVFSGSEIV